MPLDSNSLDPVPARQNVGPDLGPIFLQRLLIDYKKRHSQVNI